MATVQKVEGKSVKGVQPVLRIKERRRMRIIFLEEGVDVVAAFDFQYAPRTAQAIWDLLGRGAVESVAIHAMWAGRELAVEIPHLPEKLPLENSTVTPAPGDILFWHMDAGVSRSYPDEVTEFAIIYGPDTRMWIGTCGECPGNVFARVVDNLEGLADVARRIRFEGIKAIRFERFTHEDHQ